MDLAAAIELVGDATRAEDPDTPCSNAEAVALVQKEMDHEHVTCGVFGARLQTAHHLVLDATDTDLADALNPN